MSLVRQATKARSLPALDLNRSVCTQSRLKVPWLATSRRTATVTPPSRVSSSLHLRSNSSSHNSDVSTPEKLVPSTAQRRTIYALSTPHGKAGVAVIRISGPDALQVWHRMVRTRSHSRSREPGTVSTFPARQNRIIPGPVPWTLERCHIIDSQNGELLDDGLVVFFCGMCPKWLSPVLAFRIRIDDT